jgi:uncharacterized protein YkwD
MFIRVGALVAAVGIACGQGPDVVDKYREGILKGVNELRAKSDALPLTRNEKLDAAAQKHAENMAKQERLAHRLDGKSVKERILGEGYEARLVAENNAEAPVGSNKSPAAVVQAWRYSPGHYKNIMHELVTETGIGVAKGKSGRWYFCQVFAAPKPK